MDNNDGIHFSRRHFLKAGATVGVGLSVPWLWKSHPVEAATAPTIIDPRFTAPVINPRAIPKFMDPLPVPTPDAGGWPVIDLTAGGKTTLAVKARQIAILPAGQGMTPVWTYGDSTATYLGPTILAHRGEPITVKFDYSAITASTHLLTNGAGNRSVVDTHLHGTMADEPEVRFIAHLHGSANVAQSSDGYAEAWISQAGQNIPEGAEQTVPTRLMSSATSTPTFGHVHTYPNGQGAALGWYHDHALGITRLNVYAGMAGGYLITDANEAALVKDNFLPSGAYDLPLVIQDRMFYSEGTGPNAIARLAYPDLPAPTLAGCVSWPGTPSTMPEFFGDVMVVNGKSWPYLDVEPAVYRFRFLNGCNSRFLDLQLSPALGFTVLGTEGGFLPAAVRQKHLAMGPAERFDVLVDFRGFAGKTFTLDNLGAKKPFPKGTPPDPQTDGVVMQFRVTTQSSQTPLAPLPATLNPEDPGTLTPVNPNTPRRVLLFEGVDEFGRINPLLGTVVANGGTLTAFPQKWTDDATETPQAGTVELWEIYNTTADAHPVHIHEALFSVVDRQGLRFDKKALAMLCAGAPPQFGITLSGGVRPAEAYERGFKDTVIAYPGEVTRIQVDFRNAEPGLFVWHCHILEHEDHEMMRPLVITAKPA